MNSTIRSIITILVLAIAASGCTHVSMTVTKPVGEGNDRRTVVYQVSGVVPCWDDKDVQMAKAVADMKQPETTNTVIPASELLPLEQTTNVVVPDRIEGDVLEL